MGCHGPDTNARQETLSPPCGLHLGSDWGMWVLGCVVLETWGPCRTLGATSHLLVEAVEGHDGPKEEEGQVEVVLEQIGQ